MEKKKQLSTTSSNPEAIIEGLVKFRDGKKWKSRWCSLRKLSPVADYIHLQVYRDARDHQKGNLPKASLSLRDFMGCESGFTLDKESQTLALLCKDDPGTIIAFPGPEELLQWKTRASRALSSGNCSRWSAFLVSPGPSSGLKPGPICIHVRPSVFCIVSGVPPKILGIWRIADLRRYGVVDGRVCFEGGSRCGTKSGAWVINLDQANAFINALSKAAPPPTTASLQKRFSEISDSAQDMFEVKGTRGIYPEWSLQCGQQYDNMSHSSSSLGERGYGTNHRLSKCMNCSSRLGSPTPFTHWNNSESFTDRQSESDRTSLCSHSSGASELSIHGGCISRDDISSSSCTVMRPKSFYPCRPSQRVTGPYENYDTPKPPMPLIQEYPNNHPESFYDKPKNLRKCLISDSSNCNCYLSLIRFKEHSGDNNLIVINSESNQRNVAIKDSSNDVPEKNLLVVDSSKTEQNQNILSHLSHFESSVEILRNAGFSQDEIGDMEDAGNGNKHSNKNHNTQIITASPIDIHISNDSTIDSAGKSLNNPPLTESGNFIKRKSISTDFLKKAEEVFGITKSNSDKEISIDFSPVNKNNNYECDNLNCSKCTKNNVITAGRNSNNEMNEPMPAVQNTVKIRRSSSVPNKCPKYRESSSSSDSGVSTGSFTHHKCCIRHSEQRSKNIVYSVSKATPCLQNQETLNSFTMHANDNIEQITFQFNKAYGLVKSSSCEATHNNTTTGNKEGISPSPEIFGSDVSDYLESLSFISSSDRSLSRPRSGREYSTVLPIQLQLPPNTSTLCHCYICIQSQPT